MGAEDTLTLEVLVDDEPLPTYVAFDGDVYVESSFAAKSTYTEEVLEENRYGETFTQRWPVTPFKVRVINPSEVRFYCKLHVDGRVRPSHHRVASENSSVPGDLAARRRSPRRGQVGRHFPRCEGQPFEERRRHQRAPVRAASDPSQGRDRTSSDLRRERETRAREHPRRRLRRTRHVQGDERRRFR